MMILLCDKDWEWCNDNRKYANNVQLTRAASRQIAHDTGLMRPFGYIQITNWDRDIKSDLETGESAVGFCVKSNYTGSIA